MANQLRLDGLTKSEVLVDGQEIAFELTADGQPIEFNATYETLARVTDRFEKMLLELRAKDEATDEGSEPILSEQPPTELVKREPWETAIAEFTAPGGIPHTFAFQREIDAALAVKMKAEYVERLAIALGQLEL